MGGVHLIAFLLRRLARVKLHRLQLQWLKGFVALPDNRRIQPLLPVSRRLCLPDSATRFVASIIWCPPSRRCERRDIRQSCTGGVNDALQQAAYFRNKTLPPLTADVRFPSRPIALETDRKESGNQLHIVR